MLTHLVLSLFDTRVEKYEQVMGMFRDFFYYEKLPSQTAWGQMLDRVKPLGHYQSLLEVGYGISLRGSELLNPSPALVQTLPTNCVFPEKLQPEEKYETVLYAKVYPPLKPYALGFDLRDEPALGPTHSNADYRNSLTVTPRVPLGLRGAATNLSGFYMLRTVYDESLPVETPMRPGEKAYDFFGRMTVERNPHVLGCVFGAIDMDRLLKEVLKDTVLEVAFEIFDGPKPEESHRLNEREAIPISEDRIRRLDLTNRVLIWPKYTRRWAFVFHPTADFEAHSPRRMAWIALGAGLGITLCFTGLVWAQLRGRLAAVSHARKMDEARDVIDTLSRERARISRDLHDGVLQSLFALGLGMQQARQTIRHDPVLAEQRCQQNLEALELAMGEVRRHLDKDGSKPTEEVDLGSTLGRLAEAMNRQGQARVECVLTDGLACRPKPGRALEMMLIAREAITNAQRHSGAEVIRMALRGREGGLELIIEDDGRGFDPDRPCPNGFGLRNMAGRARDIGAEYRLEAGPGKGVRVRVHLPAADCVVEELMERIG